MIISRSTGIKLYDSNLHERTIVQYQIIYFEAGMIFVALLLFMIMSTT